MKSLNNYDATGASSQNRSASSIDPRSIDMSSEVSVLPRRSGNKMSTSHFDYQSILHKSKEILEGRGPINKQGRCTILTYCCIEAGMTEGKQIVWSVRYMDPSLKAPFIGLVLHRFGKPFWHKDPVAGYVLS